MTRSDRDKAQRKNNMEMSLSEFFDELTSLVQSDFLEKSGWKVVFEKKTIRRRIVSRHDLRKFYRSPDLHLDLERHMGVVTAIYYISGGLTFEGDANAIAKAGLDSPTTTAPFDVDAIADGWNYSVTDTGTVVVKESNPSEWIVAVEYGDVAMDKKDAELGKGRLIFIDPLASKKSFPWTLFT